MCYPIKLTEKEQNIKNKLDDYYDSIKFLYFRGKMFALDNYRKRIHLERDADFEEKIFTVLYLKMLIEKVRNAMRAYNILAMEGKVPFEPLDLD